MVQQRQKLQVFPRRSRHEEWQNHAEKEVGELASRGCSTAAAEKAEESTSTAEECLPDELEREQSVKTVSLFQVEFRLKDKTGAVVQPI